MKCSKVVSLFARLAIQSDSIFGLILPGRNVLGFAAIQLLVAANAWAGKLTPPVAPSGLAVTALSSSQIRLGWQDNSSNETGFKIDRATSSSGPWSIAVAAVG